MAGTYITIMFTGHVDEVMLCSGTLQLLLNFACKVEKLWWLLKKKKLLLHFVRSSDLLLMLCVFQNFST